MTNRYVTTEIDQTVHHNAKLHAVATNQLLREIVTEAVRLYLASAVAKTDGAR